MEEKNLQEVMELINRIADGEYDPPEPEDVAEVNRLTGQDWTAEDLRLICCEYWSHNSLEETAYQLIHGDLPVVRETDLAFWRAKSGAALDAAAVYRKYCTGGAMKALEPLPMEEILTAICGSIRICSQREKLWRRDSNIIMDVSCITMRHMKRRLLCWSSFCFPSRDG